MIAIHRFNRGSHRLVALCAAFLFVSVSPVLTATDSAGYSVRQPDIEDQIAQASVVVHGTIAQSEGCLSLDGKDAFTFVTISVQEVLQGTLSTGNDQGSLFTLRLPFGNYSDGSFSTVVGYPQVVSGDEVVLFLSYGSSGAPLMLPLAHFSDSLLRLVPDPSDSSKKRIFNGQGSPYHKAYGRFSPRGRPFPEARSMFGWDDPVQIGSVQAAIQSHSESVVWDGTSTAEGPWSGRVRLSVSDPSSNDAIRVCMATLQGTVSDNSLSATGSCDSDLEGTLNLEVSGTRISATEWQGTLTHSPATKPDRVRTIQWTSTESHPDLVVAQSSGECDDGQAIAAWDALFYITFAGERPLVDWSEFRAQLVSEISSVGVPGGIANNNALTDLSCDASFDAVDVIAGGN